MVRAVVDHDHVPDRAQLRPQRQEHRQRRAVDEHDVVLGVVRDVDLLLGEQPDVERVQHAAGARGGEVELQVRRGVPHERPDASVGRDAQRSSAVASLRTRTAQSATVVATSPFAVAVTIGLWPNSCSARWKTCGRASGRSCMSPRIATPVVSRAELTRPYRGPTGATTGSPRSSAGSADGRRPPPAVSLPVTRDDASAAVCVDVGSTWTKAVLVRFDGALAGFAEHPTTVADVLAGVDAAVRAVVAAAPGAAEPELLACSSAGGGLRLAAVGGERLTVEEAAHRVARSSGSRVVHVHAGPMDPSDVRMLRGSRPGAVLLTGGADGDDPALLLHNAARLARARVRFPIVLAGNEAARDDAVALLTATGRTVVACANVAPRPGELVPGPARAAVAQLYADHVLGGRAPSAAPRFLADGPGRHAGRGGGGSGPARPDARRPGAGRRRRLRDHGRALRGPGRRVPADRGG